MITNLTGLLAVIIAPLLLDQVKDSPRIGSREDRVALFEYILDKTKQRESFSPIKNKALGLDVEREMLRFRQDFVDAATEEELYYALAKVSNARKDRHLQVGQVAGGLRLRNPSGSAAGNYPDPDQPLLHVPIRFAVDYGNPEEYVLFVGDVTTNIQDYSVQVSIGDKLTKINGRAVDQFVEQITPYHRYSTIAGLWWQIAAWLPQQSAQFPYSLERQHITYGFERQSGERYEVTFPYLPSDALEWMGAGDQRYPGFVLALATQTYNLFVANDGKPILLLDWYGFRENLVDDIDSLVRWAQREDALDHHIIFDGTRSRGGSLGAYALQHLSPKPFRTTFGNLRVSDVTAQFVRDRLDRPQGIPLGETNEPILLDDGRWLTDWLRTDVTAAIERGDDYTSNVPFKLAHAPKDSDGILHPAPHHFTGQMVAFFGPYGGSHLDQFAAILIDNNVAYTIGTPAGGYSNTWEWEETLRFPISGQPVASFMWSIGHTIRPNGEILEGNPAKMHEYIPVTRENYADYYDILLERALEYLR